VGTHRPTGQQTNRHRKRKAILGAAIRARNRLVKTFFTLTLTTERSPRYVCMRTCMHTDSSL